MKNYVEEGKKEKLVLRKMESALLQPPRVSKSPVRHVSGGLEVRYASSWRSLLFFYFAIVRGVFLRDVEEEKIKGVEKSQRVLRRVGRANRNARGK